MAKTTKTKAKGKKPIPTIQTNVRGPALEALNELKGLMESRVPGLTLSIAQVVQTALVNELARQKEA